MLWLLAYLTSQKADLAIYYELSEGESTENRGIVEVEPQTGRYNDLEYPQHSTVYICMLKWYRVDMFC